VRVFFLAGVELWFVYAFNQQYSLSPGAEIVPYSHKKILAAWQREEDSKVSIWLASSSQTV